VIERHKVSGLEFGSPLRNCPKCHGYYIDNKKVEWDLMTTIKKIWVVLYSCTSMFVLCGVIVGFSLQLITGLFHLSSEENGTYSSVLWVVGGLIGLILSIIMMTKDINKSKLRTADDNYIAELKLAGMKIPCKLIREGVIIAINDAQKKQYQYEETKQEIASILAEKQTVDRSIKTSIYDDPELDEQVRKLREKYSKK
jgi:hypothetical protein